MAEITNRITNRIPASDHTPTSGTTSDHTTSRNSDGTTNSDLDLIITDDTYLTKDLVLKLKNLDWFSLAKKIHSDLHLITTEFEHMTVEDEVDTRRAIMLKHFSDHLNKTLRVISDLKLTSPSEVVTTDSKEDLNTYLDNLRITYVGKDRKKKRTNGDTT